MSKKLPTFSVHMHCTACGGSRVLGGKPCHCVPDPISYELESFDLEIRSDSSGDWKVWREDEHPVARYVLNDRDAVHSMLASATRTVEWDGRRFYCRLTPKSWRAAAAK